MIIAAPPYYQLFVYKGTTMTKMNKFEEYLLNDLTLEEAERIANGK